MALSDGGEGEAGGGGERGGGGVSAACVASGGSARRGDACGGRRWVCGGRRMVVWRAGAHDGAEDLGQRAAQACVEPRARQLAALDARCLWCVGARRM